MISKDPKIKNPLILIAKMIKTQTTKQSELFVNFISCFVLHFHCPLVVFIGFLTFHPSNMLKPNACGVK